MKTRTASFVACALSLASTFSAQASAVRSDIEKNMFGCYDTVIFNNASTPVRGGRIDWRYDYSDGGYSQGSSEIPAVGPGQRWNVQTYSSSDMGRCKTVRYTFKVLNVRIY